MWANLHGSTSLNGKVEEMGCSDYYVHNAMKMGVLMIWFLSVTSVLLKPTSA